jgi:hypothetical protein
MLTITTGAQHVLGASGQASSLHNHGTVTWSDGLTYIQGNSTIVNESDGTWNVGAGRFTLSSTTPPGTFTNAGSLQGAGTLATTLTISQDITYVNTGTVGNITIVH